LALLPAPTSLAFTSTKLPMCTSLCNLVSGRIRAKGPMRQFSATTALSMMLFAKTSVPAPSQRVMLLLGPILTPAASATAVGL
jgi:hypothetical protein